MNNMDMRERTTDQEKKIYVPVWIFYMLIGVGFIILFVVPVLYVRGIWTEALDSFQPWVNSLFALSGIVVGGVYVNDKVTKTHKGGTGYYPFKYRNSDMEQMIKSYNDKYTKEAHRKAAEFVVAKLDGEPQLYWGKVFLLQETDEDFVKVWNDYNFYANKNLKRDEDLCYFFDLKRYVFMHVYNECIQNHL